MKINDLPSEQAKRYLEVLKGSEPHRQLLIKVGGGLLDDKAAVLELVEAVAELTTNGVHVLLVHGGGIQLTKAIEQEGNKTRFIDGKRYTDEATLKLARSVFTDITNNLVQTLGDSGVKAISIDSTQLFRAKRDLALGFVGTEVTSVKTAPIADALAGNSVLVVGLLAHDDGNGETLNVNGDTVFRALATELKPHRMVNLTPTGGVLRLHEDGSSQELITGINTRDTETLIKEGIVSGGMALKLRELTSILDKLEPGSAISITQPSELLLELLTDQGSGTFICKGQKIIVSDKIDDVFDDFSALIVEAFGKSLPEGYRKQAFEKLYFTHDHLAFGVVTRLSDGTPYLDKLAVSPQLQGRGIGESLWYCVARDYPKIVWRSHVDNRYATWYHRHADIMKRRGEWILFGRGVDFQELEALTEEVVTIPAMK